MSKERFVTINGERIPVPNPWFLVGHPLSIGIKKQLVVDQHEAMGSDDYSAERIELLRRYASLESFWTLALHEAVEHLNSGFEWNMEHPVINQLTEALGPFVCQWFYAQLEAIEAEADEPAPETPSPLAEKGA